VFVDTPVELVINPPSDVDTLDAEDSWKDRARFPIFRGGVSVREAEEKYEETPTTLEIAEESARFLYYGLEYHFLSREERVNRVMEDD
jgi:hypothetical protein